MKGRMTEVDEPPRRSNRHAPEDPEEQARLEEKQAQPEEEKEVDKLIDDYLWTVGPLICGLLDDSQVRSILHMRLLFPDLPREDQELLGVLHCTRESLIVNLEWLGECEKADERAEVERLAAEDGHCFFHLKAELLGKKSLETLTPFQKRYLDRELFKVPLPDSGYRMSRKRSDGKKPPGKGV
ncbi:MAG TPA: hypothetical protein VJA21_19450 [Verrucomicrobiae bacterium]